MIAALFWAPSGPAKGGGATPQDIARDLSDGVLNGHYTRAELQRFLKDATLQQYGTTTTGTTGSTTSTTGSTTTSTSGAGPTGTTNGPNSGVAGTSTAQGGPGPLAVAPSKRTPLAATKARGRLPFTGAQLGLFAIVGLALLAMGFLLRSTARQKPTASESS